MSYSKSVDNKCCHDGCLGNLFSKLTFRQLDSEKSKEANNTVVNEDNNDINKCNMSCITYMHFVALINFISRRKNTNDYTSRPPDDTIDYTFQPSNTTDYTSQPPGNTISISSTIPNLNNSILKKSANVSNFFKGSCTKCGREKLYEEWCEPCDRDILKSNFSNWTSGNKEIDTFIQETQLSATTKFNFLEWIPFSSLINIEPIGEGGFGKVYRAKWVDGPRTKWNAEKVVWERYSNVDVALKCLKTEIFTELFEELKSHLKSNNELVGRFNTLRTYGITYDPEIKTYLMVTTLADDGDLSVYLKNQFSTLTYTKKLEILYDIAIGLTQIHKSGLVHRDLHSGNVMCQGIKGRRKGRGEEYRFVIGDLGQATPPKKDDCVFGVMPYIAPEVFCTQFYTQAADVYSFGILMWEITTGLKAFNDRIHDKFLMFDIIYSELRPDISPNTPKLYSHLMKRCWDNNKEKRPSAYELYTTIGLWLNQCLFAPNSDIAKEFKKGDELRSMVPQLQVLHPNNVQYSTSHDVKGLSKLQQFETLDDMNSDFEIPDSLEDL